MTARKPPPVGKLRRVVKRSKKIPTLSELYFKASELGFTVEEYVAHLNAMNMNRERRRNKSSTYDWGPYPHYPDPEEDDDE